MPIEFACSCGQRLRVADEHAGKRAKCKYCGLVVAIPGAKVVASSSVPEAPSPTTAVQKKAALKSAPTSVAQAASMRAEKPVLEPTTNFDVDDFFAANLPDVSTPGPTTGPITGLTTGPRAAATSASDSKTCLGCYGSVSSAALICTNCGYNFQSGKKTPTKIQPRSIYDEPRTKSRRSSAIGRFFHSRLTSGKMWSGVGMMVGATAWFVVAWSFNIIFVYPPILFIIGLIAFFKGLIDGDNA